MNKTTKTNLIKHIKDKHQTRLVMPFYDSQRRPGGIAPRVLQSLDVNVHDQFEAALLEFLYLTDQLFDLIDS